jgi:hypothetical protein
MYVGYEVGSARLVSGFEWAKFRLVIGRIITANTSSVTLYFILGSMFCVNWLTLIAIKDVVWYWMLPKFSLLRSDNCGSFTLQE